jgi:hypothetical protein
MSYGYEDVNVETLHVSPALLVGLRRERSAARVSLRRTPNGFPPQATGVSALRAAGLRVACRISSGDAARTAIAVALAIGIPEGQRLYVQSMAHSCHALVPESLRIRYHQQSLTEPYCIIGIAYPTQNLCN